MNWATIVLTAPRPQPTLRRTLASLAGAGWEKVLVVRDEPPRGHFRAWLAALASGVECRPDAEAYFVVEDDVVFCKGLRACLEGRLWPADPESLALCSAFTPEAYRQPQPGWHRQQRKHFLVASQAWILPPGSARLLLADLSGIESAHNADWMVGQWADRVGRSVWYHTPSLAQHVGLGNSALGDNLISDLRVAGDFIGEDAAPGALP